MYWEPPNLGSELDAHPLFLLLCLLLGLVGFTLTIVAAVQELKSAGEGQRWALKAAICGLLPMLIGVVALLVTRDTTEILLGNPYLAVSREVVREYGDQRALMRLAIGVGTGAIPFVGGALLWFVGRLPKPKAA